MPQSYLSIYLECDNLCENGCCTTGDEPDIPDEPDTNLFECDELTSSNVEEAYRTMVTMQQLDSDHEKDRIFYKLVNSVKTFRRQNVDIYAVF